MPPNISVRLQRGHKHSWYDVMVQVEEAMHTLTTVGSTVVESNKETTQEHMKIRTKRVSMLEISIMSCIFSAPKLGPEETKAQMIEYRIEIA